MAWVRRGRRGEGEGGETGSSRSAPLEQSHPALCTLCMVEPALACPPCCWIGAVATMAAARAALAAVGRGVPEGAAPAPAAAPMHARAQTPSPGTARGSWPCGCNQHCQFSAQQQQRQQVAASAAIGQPPAAKEERHVTCEGRGVTARSSSSSEGFQAGDPPPARGQCVAVVAVVDARHAPCGWAQPEGANWLWQSSHALSWNGIFAICSKRHAMPPALVGALWVQLGQARRGGWGRGGGAHLQATYTHGTPWLSAYCSSWVSEGRGGAGGMWDGGRA